MASSSPGASRRAEQDPARALSIRASVKESLDNLPVGMCFADHHGLILLLNRRMSSLSHAVTGQDLQDPEAFWKTVASGLQEAAKIKAKLPRVRVIIVTSQPECDFIDRARMGQVDSFWYKTPRAEELLTAMDRTMAGEQIYPDATPEVMVGESSSREFTARELEILRELVTGDSNAEIAERLGISEKAVRNHISQMMLKTGLGTRTKLAVAANRSGVVDKDF